HRPDRERHPAAADARPLVAAVPARARRPERGRRPLPRVHPGLACRRARARACIVPGMRRRVLVTDHAWPTLEIERSVLAGAELLEPASGAEAELVELAGGVDAILTNWRKLPAEALEAAPGCLVVSRYGVGVDNIPVERATALGILV